MLIVPIEDVRVGMKLAADMVHPSQPEQILLRRGFLLEEDVIARMRELGVIAIYVDYPDLAEIDRHLAPALSPEKLRVYGQIKETIGAVQKKTRPSVGFADYYCAIREFVITLFQQGEHPLYLEQLAVRLGDRGVSHAAAVAHLSLLLGIKLQTYLLDQRKRLSKEHATEVVNLGIAGMLHDIGKCKLTPEVARFTSADVPPAQDKALKEAWESHPRVGYEMVRRSIEPSASVAILQHHQRFDGKGFPEIVRKGQTVLLGGTDIHVFGRIVHVANLFDRLTHGSDVAGEKERRPAFVVLHLLRTQYGAAVDPVVLSALEQTVPPFPPGGRVRLSDGTDAVVTALSRDPYRPIVRRMVAGSLELEEQGLDLTMAGMPGIESADGVRVAEYLPGK